MIKAIFFDYDMTLVNSKSIARKSYNALCKASEIKPSEKGFDAYVGRRVSESIEFFAKTGKSKKELKKTFLKVHEGSIKNLEVYGKNALKHLKKKKIKVIIISNNSREVILKVCEIHKLHFDKIIADEDMKKGWKKHQEIHEEIKRLKLKKSEALYIGDHINDVKEARKAGIRIASITTGVFNEKELKPYHPDFIIKNLEELKRII